MKSEMEGNEQFLIPSLNASKKKSIVGKESHDPQPGPSGPKAPVLVEDDKMAVYNPLSFSAPPSFSD